FAYSGALVQKGGRIRVMTGICCALIALSLTTWPITLTNPHTVEVASQPGDFEYPYGTRTEVRYDAKLSDDAIRLRSWLDEQMKEVFDEYVMHRQATAARVTATAPQVPMFVAVNRRDEALAGLAKGGRFE